MTDKNDGYVVADLVGEQVEAINALLDATAMSQAETPAELKDTIMNLLRLRFQGFAPSGVRLLELNRRYGGVAAELGTTVRNLIKELNSERLVFTQVYKDSFVSVPRELYNVHIKNSREMGLDIVEEAERVLRRSFPQDVPGKVSRKRRATKSLSDL